jgi:nitrate/nitrite-specific signal transduction histidine kinase
MPIRRVNVRRARASVSVSTQPTSALTEASAAFVRLDARDRRVTMVIGDDGCGFDATLGYPGRIGLESMRSRAREIEAELKISSTPGRGTVISVDVPSGEQEPARVA